MCTTGAGLTYLPPRTLVLVSHLMDASASHIYQRSLPPATGTLCETLILPKFVRASRTHLVCCGEKQPALSYTTLLFSVAVGSQGLAMLIALLPNSSVAMRRSWQGEREGQHMKSLRGCSLSQKWGALCMTGSGSIGIVQQASGAIDG